MQIDTEQTPILDLNYASTFEEYREAARVWSMNSGKGRKIRYQLFVRRGYLTAAICVVVGVAGAYVGLSPAVMAEQGAIGTLWEFMGPLFAGLAGGGAVVLFNPMRYRRRLGKIFRQGKFGLPCVTRFYPEGLIAIRKDGAIQSSFAWNSFEAWAESADVFVLMLSKVQFTWIPKRVLSLKEQNQLRELLSVKIPAGQVQA